MVEINRAQKRKFAKKMGVDYATLRLMESVIDNHSEEKIMAGDKVMIDLKKIQSRKHYDSLQQDYRSFIEESKDVVFTAIKEDEFKGKPIVSLEEDPRRPRWAFCEDELILLKSEEAE